MLVLAVMVHMLMYAPMVQRPLPSVYASPQGPSTIAATQDDRRSARTRSPCAIHG
jgi:hypothetical protein